MRKKKSSLALGVYVWAAKHQSV